MAIRTKRNTTYIADTGKEFVIEEMTDSHLLNTIAHHVKQVEALANVYNRLDSSLRGHLMAKLEILNKTIEALGIELAMRDPNTEEERRQQYVENKWSDRNGY